MLCTIAVLLAAWIANAQDRPNFSGTWVLDTEKSDFGDLPIPGSQTNVIDQSEPDIQLTQTITGESVPGGRASTQRHYSTDGKESSNDLGGRQVKSTARWDGNRLLVETRLDAPEGKIAIRDLWEMTSDRKQMTITRDFQGPQGDHHQKLIFNQQGREK
jgi:hypothetical protein